MAPPYEFQLSDIAILFVIFPSLTLKFDLDESCPQIPIAPPLKNPLFPDISPEFKLKVPLYTVIGEYKYLPFSTLKFIGCGFWLFCASFPLTSPPFIVNVPEFTKIVGPSNFVSEIFPLFSVKLPSVVI